MKMIIAVALLFIALHTSAQDRLASQKKRQQEMSDRLEKLMSDPRMKAYQDDEDEEEQKTFPQADKKKLALLPATPGNESQLGSYLKNLYTAYTSKIPVAAVTAANEAMRNLQQDAGKMSMAATAGWYNGYADEALLLAIKAGIQEPADPLILNNLGAMLNLGGAQWHALPLMRSLVQQYPGNAMLLNNLGQSYAGIGELDSAMHYFRRCLQKSPNHPEANHTAGQIEQQRGNSTKAIEHFRNSLKGAYNTGAWEGLRQLAGDDYHRQLPRLIPDELPYFNEYKYQLPRQCSGPGDAPYIAQEHADFVRFIQNIEGAYASLAHEELQKGNEEMEKASLAMQQQLMKALQSGKPLTSMPGPGGPLYMGAMRRYADLGMQLPEEAELHRQQLAKLEENFTLLKTSYDKRYQDLKIAYDKKAAQYNCGEGRGADCAALIQLNKELCEKLVDLGNTSQGALSAAKKDIQAERLRYLRWELNATAHYGYLTGANEHLANAAFLKAAAHYLGQLKQLAYNPVVVAGGRCDDYNLQPPQKDEQDATKTMNCPIDLDIPFVVGKLKLNCNEFSFSAGEGVIFKMKKDFVTRQSTLTISAGLQFEGSKQWGIFSGEASASATQSFFITWDGNNTISDAGIAFTSEAGIKAASDVKTPGNIGKNYLQEFQQEIGQQAGFGYTLGINSGWSFNDGYLSGLVKSLGIIR